MKDLNQIVIWLGTLALLLHSTSTAAQSMLDRITDSCDVLCAQSSLPTALDGSWPLLHPFPKSVRNNSLNRANNAFPDGPDSSPNATPYLPVQPKVQAPDTKFHWRVAIQESLLFTGIMHTFNLATEAGTRDTLNGPWFKDYVHSVGELRGWSDDDTFMAPYVGHTIEGSVFGFIQRQNDPKYRQVQWGDGRDYFISLLRSMAYSAVWHTQWKIGPISEASIGNVMLHASPGFITLTDTPTLGAIAMIGEDVADRYLIMGLENWTANRPLMILTRVFLNPGRSFANIMAFREPWYRETRIGLFHENYRLRKELLANYERTGEKPFEFIRRTPPAPESTRSYPLEAPIELMAFPYY